jgi:DNA-binding CsgD family transcriptional regulator
MNQRYFTPVIRTLSEQGDQNNVIPETSRLLGREGEWDRVAGMIERGSHGHSSTLVIEGGPGVGKTRLLREAERAAKSAGFAVSSHPVFAAGSPAGDPDTASLLASLDVGRGEVTRPRLVVVDDFHRLAAEPANAVLSPARCGRTPLVRLIGLGACQESPALRWAANGSERPARLELGGLSDDAALELASDLLGGRPDRNLGVLLSGAGGNPQLVSELVRGLREEGLVRVAGGSARLTEERMPQRIQNTALHWLWSMSEKARQLVQVTAGVGGSIMIGDVAAMLRETTASILPALNEAMAMGLLACRGELAVCRHEVVRRSISAALPQAVRRALRQDVDALRSQRSMQGPVPPAVLGNQGLIASTGINPVPPLAQPPLTSPSQVGVPLQPGIGDHAGGAITGPGSVSRLVPALLMARSTRTEPLSMQLAEDLRAELTAVLTGDYPHAVAGAALAAPAVGAERASRIARNIVSLFAEGEHHVMDRARAVLAEGAAEVDQPDVMTAMVVTSNLEWAAGNLADGLKWGRDAAQSAGPGTPPLWRWYAELALACKLSDIGQFDEAEKLINVFREETDGLADTSHAATPLIAQAKLMLQSSRLQEAREAAQAGLAAAGESGVGWVVPVGQAMLILVALRCGDLSSATDYVWRCRAAVGSDPTVFPSIQFDWAECLVATAQLGPRRTGELLTTHYVHLLNAPQLLIEEAGAAPWLVRLALAAEDLPLATSVVAAAERLAAINPDYRTLAVVAAHARGLVERDGDRLRRAAREHVSPCAGALADEDLGVLHAAERGRRGARAVGALRSALRRFEQIGSQGDADRVRAFMSEYEVSPAPAAQSAKCTGSGWDALTDTERTIARLVSDGLTNRQVARRVSRSPHTVNYYLRSIFRKLDINSRVEVARYVAYGS